MPARARLGALVLPLVLVAVAGCTDPAPPETPVASPSVALPGGHDACSLLSASDVKPALAPTSASPAPTVQGDPQRAHDLVVVPTTVGSTLKTAFPVDRCDWSDPNGQSVIVSIYAASSAMSFTGKLSELTELVQGASPVTLGSATAAYSSSKTSAVLAFQDGSAVVALGYPAAEPAAGVSREQRLVNLAARVLGVPAPTVAPITAPIALASPSASATPAPPPGKPTQGASAATTVTETDQLKFEPANVSVKVGSVVAWTNTGQSVHNVTFAGQKSITSQTMQNGNTWQVQFTLPGTYNYVCTFHVSSNMTGVVTVTP